MNCPIRCFWADELSHSLFSGLMAWTVGSWGDPALWRTAWPQCRMQGWHVIWHCYELLFLLYGMRLCYKVVLLFHSPFWPIVGAALVPFFYCSFFKARNSDWLERWQFTVAVCLEAVITLMANLIRYSLYSYSIIHVLLIPRVRSIPASLMLVHIKHILY